ncbi:hypothetical protein BESB_005350 [Besnoitia besnoiti]|uniref:Uncharacterized protein n=1 Tax=Besnoitia besnoiti TaxID=94643 RepID=A0A2A9MLP5_BESBE|nr:hypothetical protein BESB_005350 [Besnoitia besnoiti]PFH38194.1 hypothetical protein BESB_005350 [Besnoitia besnoiti]
MLPLSGGSLMNLGHLARSLAATPKTQTASSVGADDTIEFENDRTSTLSQFNPVAEGPLEINPLAPSSANQKLAPGSLSISSPSPPQGATLLYITETVATDAAQMRSRPTVVDVYIAAFNDTMYNDHSDRMIVSVFYGNGTAGDTVTAHLQNSPAEGVWKRPFPMHQNNDSPIRRGFDLAGPAARAGLDKHRVQMSTPKRGQSAPEYVNGQIKRHSDQGHGHGSRGKNSSLNDSPRRRGRALRRRNGSQTTAYIQFQPAYGQDLHTFVHIAAGKVEAELVAQILLNPTPEGDIWIRNVLEIPHAFRKWVNSDYAPLWDPEFIVTGDYWSSTLTPWFNTTSIPLSRGTYVMAEGFYKQRHWR